MIWILVIIGFIFLCAFIKFDEKDDLLLREKDNSVENVCRKLN